MAVFLQFLNFVLSQYVAQVFSWVILKWFQLPLLLRVSLSPSLSTFVEFLLWSLCILKSSQLLSWSHFCHQKLQHLLTCMLLFFLSSLIMLNILLPVIVLSVRTCWFHNMVTLHSWIVSTYCGTWSYHCLLSNFPLISLYMLKCGNKMPTRCNRYLLHAEHVSGNTMPETCWACNKYHLLHLVGILFPHNNDDARSKSLQMLKCIWSHNLSCLFMYCSFASIGHADMMCSTLSSIIIIILN